MSVGNQNARYGLARWKAALAHSWRGLCFAWQQETAVREEVLAILLLTPVAFLVADSGVELVLLLGSLILVLITELLNSAVEATIDKFEEQNPLFGAAKDLGSAAVLMAILLAVICWLVIGLS